MGCLLVVGSPAVFAINFTDDWLNAVRRQEHTKAAAPLRARYLVTDASTRQAPAFFFFLMILHRGPTWVTS
jgi:hypothetical protein